jgi:hypothetical protein
MSLVNEPGATGCVTSIQAKASNELKTGLITWTEDNNTTMEKMLKSMPEEFERSRKEIVGVIGGLLQYFMERLPLQAAEFNARGPPVSY